MNISKYILLISLILLPVLGYAQKIGGKYIVTTGDTTQIVNSVSGLRSPDAKFLFKKNNAVSDSILANMTSDYSSLEEALMDVNSLISTVEKDQIQLKTGNTGLSYRLSKMNLESMQKEKQAKAMADSVLRIRHIQSVEEMARKYEEFGNKPTYFVNGINVEPEMINQIMSGDIVERNLKVQDTSSGNPNGEVWFIITDKAAQRLGLQVAKVQSGREYPEPAPSVADPSYKVEKTKNSSVRTESKSTSTKNTAVEDKSKKQEKTKKPRRSVRQIKADREAKDNRDEENTTPAYQPAPQPAPVQSAPKPQPRPARKTSEPEVNTQPQATQSSPVSPPAEKKQPAKTEPVQQATSKPKTDSSAPKQERKTYVRARTVNNEEVKVSDPIDSAAEPLD